MSAVKKKHTKVLRTSMIIVVISLLAFLLLSAFYVFQLFMQVSVGKISSPDVLLTHIVWLAIELIGTSLLLGIVICVAVYRNVRPVQREMEEAFWKAEESGHEAEYLNMHDNLTGLYNRDYWDGMMQRVGEMGNFGILLVVLDSLKLTNDALGYTTGEKVLVTCAQCLRSHVGDDGMLARVSGAEFAVLYPWGDEKIMAAVYEKALGDLQELNKSGRLVPMHISAGWSVARSAGDDFRKIYAQAYEKMIKVKKMNQHFVTDSIFSLVVEKLKRVDYVNVGHIDNLMALVYEFFEIYEDNVYIENLSFPRLEMLVRYHDIGKVGLREDIHEASSFTLEDRLEMDRHVTIGYQVAMYIPHLASIADLILRHHEWWDGTGSVFQYHEEYIPLECRLFSIIDAFESMTGMRPFRRAVSVEKALFEINKYAGRQFDPTLARMFSLMIRARV